MSPDIDWFPDFLNLEEAQGLYWELQSNILWQQIPITLFGKTHLQPRLIHYQGERPYTYSRITLDPQTWSPSIDKLRKIILQRTGHSFNSALLNYYRNGDDYMGWHADDEASLGKNPVISSISLGAVRPLHFRLKSEQKIKYSMELTSGSLLVMKGQTQHLWEHSLPKRKSVSEGRINITFRQIKI